MAISTEISTVIPTADTTIPSTFSITSLIDHSPVPDGGFAASAAARLKAAYATGVDG